MPDKRLEFPFGQNDKCLRLALLIDAIQKEEVKFANEKERLKNDFKNRLANLRIEMLKLKDEVLTGQTNLLDAIPTEANSAQTQSDHSRVNPPA